MMMSRDEMDLASVRPERGIGFGTKDWAGGRAVVAAAAFAFVSLSGVAETLRAPAEYVHGFINGYFYLMAYSFDAANANHLPVEVQMKGPDDSDWTTIPTTDRGNGQYTYDGSREPFKTELKTGVTTTGTQVNYLHEHTLKTNFFGTASFRMRTKSGDDTSDWVELGESTAYPYVAGTPIYDSGLAGTNAQKPNDGRLQDLIDGKTDTWWGLDLGRTMKVRGVRYYSRGDASFYRINSAHVEYADNSAFANPVTGAVIVATSSGAATSTADRRHITFLEMDEPVEARYVRMCSSVTGNERQFSLSEMEVVVGEIPYSVTVTSGLQVDSANAYPKVSWTVPAAACPVSNRVLRATVESGPYTEVSAWTAGTGSSFADQGADAKVSVGYYYKVEIWCDHPAFRGEDDDKVLASDPTPILYRSRRLDRDPSTGALQTGVDYMTLTNGSSSAQMKKAFDGDTGTWPDDITLFYGPVGLKFPEKVWVSTFGYVCRPNQTARMKMVSLFSADSGDTALDDKVRRSPFPTQTDGSGTMFYLDADSFPTAGADEYFLWKCDGTSSTFHGNVAELQFFGWNQDDIDAAGVLAPPTGVTLAPLATGVRIAWAATSVATGGFDVQRTVHGETDWVTVYEGADKSVRSYDDLGLAAGNYDYRVIAKRDAETAASSSVSIIFYVRGNGTGLRSTLFWPFVATDPAYSSPTGSCARGVEAPALAFAADESFAPTVSVCSNAVLAMKGKIVVPFSGTYTFRLDTADGGSVSIDDNWAASGWVGATPTDSIALTAGEHDIEIHARLESAENRVKLYWSGPVDEELVPASQLFPSDASYAYDRGDDWKARFYGGTFRGEVYGTSADASVSVKAGPQGATNWRTDSKMVFFSHGCSNSFSLSARVDDTTMGGSGDFGLMVRALNGNFLRFRLHNTTQAKAESVVQVLKNGQTWPTTVATGPIFKANDLYDMKIRYDRATGVFDCYAKCAADKNYTLVGSWTNDGTLPDAFDVGYFVGGTETSKNCGNVAFKDRRFHERRGLAIILK